MLVMQRSTKALLLSGLIFPGCGYFAVQQAKKAWATIVIAMASLAFMFKFILDLAEPLMQKIQAGDLPADPELMSTILHQSIASSDTRLYYAAFGLLILLWLVSCIDGFIAGKRLDQQNTLRWK